MSSWVPGDRGVVTVLAVAAAVLAGWGVGLVYSAVQPAAGRLERTPRPRRTPGRRSKARSLLDEDGGWRGSLRIGGVSPAELVVALGLVGLAGGGAAYLLFDALVPAVLSAAFSATFPLAGYRRRQAARTEAARAEWPRLLEEVRLRTGSLGRSVPQALFEAGRRAPEEWRSAFDAAEREWLLTVDFARTVGLLKARLADPTADVVGETLLMAHEIGGTDLESTLAELIEDRTQDVEHRKDAASRLAGVRFARRFVLVVPLGMALAGLTIGSGRRAYATAGGQMAVVAGLLAIAVCWWWAGRLMRIPGAPRVFR